MSFFVEGLRAQHGYGLQVVGKADVFYVVGSCLFHYDGALACDDVLAERLYVGVERAPCHLITEATVTDAPKNTQLEDAIAAATAGQQGGGMY